MRSLLFALCFVACACTKDGAPTSTTSPVPSTTATATATATATETPSDSGHGLRPRPPADSSSDYAGAPSSSTSPSTSTPTPTSASASLDAGPPIGGAARPLRLIHVPSSPKPGEKFALILELHGYGADGPSQDQVLGLQSLVDTERVILAAPDGIRDNAGDHFWNATDTCCNFENRPIDDVAYLRSLVEEIDRVYGVDRDRVFAVGHSNGGSMTFRLACDASDMFAAVVSVAGVGWEDEKKCKPLRPVAVRHMHGTRDGLIAYDGGPMPALAGHHPTTVVPPAAIVVRRFAALDGCNLTPNAIGDLDLDLAVPGDESHLLRYSGCRDGTDVEFVTMDHVGHMLWKPSPTFVKSTWEFLKTHARHAP